MSARRDHAITVLRTALQNGPVRATVLEQTLGCTHDDLRAAKKALGIVALRDRDPKTARTIRWRWSLPTHVTPARPHPPLRPHIWGLYSYDPAGRFFFLRAQADTFKTFALDAFDPPLWVLLVIDPALVLPLRIAADAVPAFGSRWKALDLTGRRRAKGGGAKAKGFR